MKLLILSAIFVAFWGLVPLSAQESTDQSMAGDQESANEQDVGLADVVFALERINEKLDRNTPEQLSDPDHRRGIGGGPFAPYRYFLDFDNLNEYVNDLGTYSDLSRHWIPFVNNMGGSMRLPVSDTFQLGLQSWGGGVSSLGFRSTGADSPDTIDQDGDDQDDYYSYVSYGINMLDILAHIRIPVVPNQFFFAFGGAFGIGSDNFSLDRNQRTLNNVAGISALFEDPDWSRALIDLGAYVTFQLQPDPDSPWFKLSLNGGFNYPVALETWAPSAGVHKDEPAPPEDFVPSHIWASFGFDFNF